MKGRGGAEPVPDDRYRAVGGTAIHPVTASAVIVAVVALLPLVVRSPYWLGVLIVSMYFALLAAAWNVLSGFVGQISLAPATFAMLGGYTSGLLWHHFGVTPLWGIPAAVGVTALLGMVLGRVTFKLSGPYFTLTTLGFAEISRVVVANSYRVTRGDLGLHLPALVDDRLHAYYVFLAAVALAQVGLYALLHSRAGLFLRAIRDDEVAAAGRGIDVVLWKTVAFAVSSALCGLAGALYVHFSRLASPEMGLILQSGLVLSMAVIGGWGTLVGPLIGAFVVQIASEALRMIGVRHMLVFALVVIVSGRFFRQGLWGWVESAFTGRRLGTRAGRGAGKGLEAGAEMRGGGAGDARR